MQCRDISSEDFERIASELSLPRRQSGPVESIRGIHKDLGKTLLLRDGSRCMALVDSADGIDVMPKPDGHVICRAMRAGMT